jgi:hypothetical protein
MRGQGHASDNGIRDAFGFQALCQTSHGFKNYTLFHKKVIR